MQVYIILRYTSLFNFHGSQLVLLDIYIYVYVYIYGVERIQEIIVLSDNIYFLYF